MPSCVSAQQRLKPLSCVLVVGGEEKAPENKDSITYPKAFKLELHTEGSFALGLVQLPINL